MPPKDLPQPSPQDTGLSKQPFEAAQGQKMPQIPEVAIESWHSEVSREHLEERNMEIAPLNRELQMYGLTPDNAIRVIQLKQRLDLGSINLGRQAVRVAAVYLGLCDPDDPNMQPRPEDEPDYLMPTELSYLYTALERDIRAAASFAEFSIDPREVVKEYRNFPWEEAIKDRLKPDEVVPAKPRFAAFAKMILHSAMTLKSRELEDRAKTLRSAIPSETFGPGFRSTEDTRVKGNERSYQVAADTISRSATARPKEFTDLSDSVWYGLITGKIRKLASTQALARNSQFVDDLLTKTKPVQSYPLALAKYREIDLATIITPKPVPK